MLVKKGTNKINVLTSSLERQPKEQASESTFPNFFSRIFVQVILLRT